MFLQARIHMPQAVPVLKRIAGLRQVRVAHHHVHGPDTGSKSGRKRITKKDGWGWNRASLCDVINE